MDSVGLDTEVDTMEVDSMVMDSVGLDSEAGVGAGDCLRIHLDRTSHRSGRSNLCRKRSGFDDGKRLG